MDGEGSGICGSGCIKAIRWRPMAEQGHVNQSVEQPW